MAQHPALGEDRREIVEREHRQDTRQCQGVAGVNSADRRMGMRAAHERRMQDACKRDVVDEPSLADEQGAVLETRNARSDQSAHVLARLRFAVTDAQSDIALAALAMTSFGVA